MSTDDPTPDPDPDDPVAESEASEVDDGETPERLPPGPDDVPIANLPPPSSALVDPPPPQSDDIDDPPRPEADDDEPDGGDEGEDGEAEQDAPDPEATTPDATTADDAEPADAATAERDERWADLADPADAATAERDERWADLADPEEPEPAGETVPGDDAGGDAGPEVDAVAPAPMRTARPGRRASRLTIIAVVVAVVAAALALAKAQQVGDLTTQRDDRRAIERVAAAFGSAYLSYDFAHADASGRAVQALATTSFATSYAAQSAPGIQELFSSRQTTTKATTTEVFVGGVSAKHARALVVVDVTATSPADGEQRLDDVSFVLDLDRTSGGWRVAEVARAPQPALDTSTSTSAPPP